MCRLLNDSIFVINVYLHMLLYINSRNALYIAFQLMTPFY